MEVLNDEPRNTENVSDRWSGAGAGFTVSSPRRRAADKQDGRPTSAQDLARCSPLLAAFGGKVKGVVSDHDLVASTGELLARNIATLVNYFIVFAITA